jgi:4-hydroxy-2-oxoheptanedioate aldolase
MRASKTLKKLREGEVVKVAVISRFPQPWLAELIGRLGFDTIWFDLEHRGFNEEAVEYLSLPCRHTDTDLMVRILKSGYHSPMRVLEMGANGILVPHCMSAREAREWVSWTKFPPLGRRGFDGAGADSDYLLADSVEYIEHANRETFLALQIEDQEAVDCVDEIAAVEGVDLLFVGPGDLSLSFGVPFQFQHPKMLRAVERVAEAACRRQKHWGIATGSVEDAQRAVDAGAQMVTCANDMVLVVAGFQQSADEFRALRTR